ncbi:MAG: hypothetical protein IJ568_00930 [Bacilli bacterium]|nr:hypothetical protein [Bacilli bacterium]
MRVCSRCGERNEDWMDICQRCGYSIVNADYVETKYKSNRNDSSVSTTTTKKNKFIDDSLRGGFFSENKDLKIVLIVMIVILIILAFIAFFR